MATVKSVWQRWLKALTDPDISAELEAVIAGRQRSIPVLWLLGKTGSGKSSVVQRITGNPKAVIGEGFEPCTRHSQLYDYPVEAPVMRFLDTRGLGEAHYDAREDVSLACQGSHALLLLQRVDDPAQNTVLQALESILDNKPTMPVLLVHTALHTVADNDRPRVIAHHTARVATVLGREPTSVSIDFTPPEEGFDNPNEGLDDLCNAITSLLPELSELLRNTDAKSEEAQIFYDVRPEILGYAGASAAVDVLPTVGLVAVPGIQGKMLHALAGRYAIAWDKKTATEFIAALGSSFVSRYLVSLGARQLGKLIPVYGQSVGAATAASISFASTYALGRTACLYFYYKNHHHHVDQQQLQAAFKAAFKQQR